MKGHTISPRHISEKAGRLIHARKDGGRLKGEDAASEDVADVPNERLKENGVTEEAKETKVRKRGGKAEKKHAGNVEGEEHKCHGGRAPRKRGGACERDPFSSAH